MPNPPKIDPEAIRAVVDGYRERLTVKAVEAFLRYLDRNGLTIKKSAKRDDFDRTKLVNEFMRSEEWK